MCVCAAKNRSISLPLDLESQITTMLSSSSFNSLSRSNPNYKSSTRSSRPSAPNNPWDYKNIIEKLQVRPLKRLFNYPAAFSPSCIRHFIQP